jgi:biotin synthase-related radical SAM superfamily protein
MFGLVSCQPLTVQNIELLAQSGVDRIGIALDAVTESLFNKIKGCEVVGVMIGNVFLISL